MFPDISIKFDWLSNMLRYDLLLVFTYTYVIYFCQISYRNYWGYCFIIENVFYYKNLLDYITELKWCTQLDK